MVSGGRKKNAMEQNGLVLGIFSDRAAQSRIVSPGKVRHRLNHGSL